MSAPPELPSLRSDAHRLGAGLSVWFEVHGGRNLDVEWHPRMPTAREFRRIAARYRTARNSFVSEVASRTGMSTAIVEIE